MSARDVYVGVGVGALWDVCDRVAPRTQSSVLNSARARPDDARESLTGETMVLRIACAASVLCLVVVSAAAAPRFESGALSMPAATQEILIGDESQRAATLSKRDLQRLRWIEGQWVGARPGSPRFFERYRFPSDTTLLVETFSDSTFTRVRERTRYILAHGRLANEDQFAQWEVTSWTPRRVMFSPVRNVRNTFIWEYRSANEWVATLIWSKRGAAAHSVVYRMTRANLTSTAR